MSTASPPNTTNEQIKIQLPDGSVREVARGSTSLDIANSISPRLAAAVVVARIKPLTAPVQAEAAEDEAKLAQTEEAMYAGSEPAGERLVDLRAPLTEDVSLELLKESDPATLRVLRHSAAHVMATAIAELFPETKFGHGPATENGFFYDVYREIPFTELDLAAIEARMAEVVKRDEPFLHVGEPREQGLAEYRNNGEFMKVHFIERFTAPGDEISLYKNGSFTDFCRGPHVPSTGRIKAFKVMSIAGPTGWARKIISSCNAFTGPLSSTARISKRISSTWKRSRRATIACWASSSTCSAFRRSRARV